MEPACRKYLLDTMKLSDQLIKLTNEAQSECNDDRCMVLFGIILDSAFKIRLEAEIRLEIMETETATHGSDLKSSTSGIERPRRT